MTFAPFAKVAGAYGAPMGRSSRGVVDGKRAIVAHPQGGGDGYDKGGAYWGLPSNVWAVWSHGQGPTTVQYVRASNREQAVYAARTPTGENT